MFYLITHPISLGASEPLLFWSANRQAEGELSPSPLGLRIGNFAAKVMCNLSAKPET